MAEYVEWIASQHLASINITDVEGGIRFKRFMDKFSKNDYSLQVSGKRRVMISFQRMKFQYPVVNDIYSCMVMTAVLDDITIHYAYAYWQKGHETGDPDYICLSATYDSRDGEFRNRFMPYSAVVSMNTDFLDTEVPIIENIVMDMISTGVLELKSSHDTDTRILITALVVAIVLDGPRALQDEMMLHTNIQYINFMKAFAAHNPIIPTPKQYFTQPRAFTTGICGQKMVPMYTREVIQPYDYNFSTWRELEISQLVSDLVINFISPSFALYNKWFYVENTDTNFFENASMQDKHVRSMVALSATGDLRDARHKLSSTDYASVELKAHIYDNIIYSQSFLLMSDIAVVHILEDVGFTLQSIHKIPDIASFPVFTTVDYAARFIFDLVYAAHCLHTKIAVVHADLHENNMSLYFWGNLSTNAEISPQCTGSVIAFITGPRGEADTYIFPTTGANTCIIDYSRAIIGPAFRPHLEKGRSPQYATNFYRDQVNRVMRAFHRYIPEYVAKNQEVIRTAVITNFEAVFPILCAIDYIAIGAAIASVCTNIIDKQLNPKMIVVPEAIEIAKQIETLGRELLITGLQQLVMSKAHSHIYPGTTVIERVFERWSFSKWIAQEPGHGENVYLSDIYNYNNSLRYSSVNYEAYPPWVRLEDIEPHLGEIKLSCFVKHGMEQFLASVQTDTHVEVLAEHLRAEQDKLDGDRMSAASSWINE